MKDFYDRVYDLMRLRGYTAIELSKKIGRHYRHLETMKARDADPKSSDLIKIAAALSVTAEELMTGKKPSPLTGYSEPRSTYENDPRFNETVIAPRMSVAFKDDETLDVREAEGNGYTIPLHLVRGLDTTTLRAVVVKGDEMINIGMAPGDIVIYDYGDVAGNGLYVVRLSTMIAVRKLEFSPVGTKVTIKTENNDYQSVTMECESNDFQPLGKVVALLHRYAH